MLEIAANCMQCSRMFVLDCPPGGEVPWHLDPLLGLPCPASGTLLHNYLEVASLAHARIHDVAEPDSTASWPRWQDHRRRPRPARP